MFCLFFTVLDLICATWDLAPAPEIELQPRHSESGVLATRPAENSLSFIFKRMEKDTQRLVDLLQASLVLLASQEEEGLCHRPFSRIWGNFRDPTEVKTGALFKALEMWAFSMPRTCWG